MADLLPYVAIRKNSLAVGDVTQHPRDRDAFARADGFADYTAMHAWFSNRYGQDTFIGWLHRWHWPSPEACAPDAEETCFICAEAFKADDVCALDINEGVCHAACIEGAPVVDLETGEEVDGPIDTFLYSEHLHNPKGAHHD